MDESLDRLESLFAAALHQPPADRAAYLDQACADDPALRQRVEALLRAQVAAGSFLEPPSPRPVATVDEPPPSERPGTVIGPYKLLQQIGEGGMGSVFMAEQTHPVRRKVALKVIKAGMDSRQVIARFEAERQALALMDHVNIARVLDAGATEAGRPYFVMELVHGVPITRYCDDNHLTPRQRLELFVPVCQAIQHAHQKGIIHRDVKPSNVLVTLYDGKPVPKVIDFGVAKAAEQNLTERTLFTQYGTLVGTLEYMSPEQAEMSALGVDTRSDIYSLGVLLYELLTGSTPLSHKRLKEAAYAEILRMIKEEEPPRPSTRLSDSGQALASISANRHTEPAKLSKLMRGELDWIVMKTLEKDRSRRYETASGFAMDVQHYLNDETVQACPPSAGYRFRKFARRNMRALATAALLSVTLLVAVGAVAGSLGWVARDQAARQLVLEQEITRALEETEDWYKRDKLPEAMAAVKRAEGLLAAGSAGQQLGQRQRQWRADLDLVGRLDEIRLEVTAVKDDHFDWAAADPAYREAFHGYGLDVGAFDPAESAKRLQASAVRDRLVATLDDWVHANKLARLPGEERLLAVARGADPDPWRGRLRDAYGRKDAKVLAELARDEPILSQPPQTLLLLVNALRVTGQRPLALEVLRRAQPHHPSDFWVYHHLGFSLMEFKPPRAAEAVGFYRAAVALRPESPGARLNLSIALREQGDLTGAEAECRKAVHLKPEYADAHAGLGATLQRRGDRDGAVAALREAVRLRPDSADVHFLVGSPYRRMGLLDEAAAAYREAIRLRPDYSGAHNNLGFVFTDKGLPDAAIAEYREALRLNPDNLTPRGNLAGELVKKELLDEAVAECRELLRRNPDDHVQAYSAHVTAYHTLGRVASKKGLWDEAIAQYGKAIELDPKFAEAHGGLGWVLMQKGRIDEAIAASRQAIRLKPDYAFALMNLDLFLSKKVWDLVNHPDPKLRDPKRAVELGNEAVERGKQAVELTPLSAEAWQYLGWAQYRSGNWTASIEALEKSCKLQKGGTGDAGQWIVLSLAHGKLAIEKELPEPERLQHKAVARRLYDQAAKQIDGWGPGNSVIQAIRAFRAEAAEMLTDKDNQK